MHLISGLVRSGESAATRFISAMCYLRRRNIFLFCVGWAAFLILTLYAFTDFLSVIPEYLDQGTENYIRFYRDVYTQERWPETEGNLTRPGEIPHTVHYYWCGRKVFRFEHYLSLLSAVRVLKPQKIIFHYHDPPVVDSFWYHTWFQELKQSVPNLVLRYTSRSPPCASVGLLRLALGYLAQEGGIYLGERTVVTRVPRQAWTSDFWSSFLRVGSLEEDVTQGVVFSKKGFPRAFLNQKMPGLWNASSSSSSCYSVDEFNSKGDKDKETGNGGGGGGGEGKSVSSGSGLKSAAARECLVIQKSTYPKDIWNSTTKFAELGRWLFYGHRKRLQVEPDPFDVPLIPMVAHMVWVRTNNILKTNEFIFLHYLSVLSALYVAGFERVYIHGEIQPYGPWWDRLRDQNVTFIKIEKPETIFQQEVRGPSHQSDVLRLNILLRHGGVYQDRDIIWVSRIPRWLRRYQAVACVDWPRNGAWPEVFNLGVMMAKPNAQWLKHFLQTFSYYRDDKWAFNAIMMPYKTYEFHPDTLFVDRHLQVICFDGICHPAWHEDYIRDIADLSPVSPFDWRQARAYHFTKPKPPDSLKSPEAIRSGQDMFGQMGKMILEKSGQHDLL